MRSMDEILSEEPRKELPDGPEREAPSDGGDESGEKPEPKEAKATHKEADDGEDPDPSDFSAGGLRKALTAERKQRREERQRAQALQRQLDQLTGETKALRERPAAPKVEPKPEDLDAEFYANPVAFVRKHGQAAKPDIEGLTAKARIDISEVYAREKHEDYDEKVKAFTEAADQNPNLWKQLAASPSPAEFAYKKGTDHLEMGDPDAWRERERAKIRAELSGEPVDGPRERPAKVLPKPSIASARGSGAGSQKWSGPRATKDIFGD